MPKTTPARAAAQRDPFSDPFVEWIDKVEDRTDTLREMIRRLPENVLDEALRDAPEMSTKTRALIKGAVAREAAKLRAALGFLHLAVTLNPPGAKGGR